LAPSFSEKKSGIPHHCYLFNMSSFTSYSPYTQLNVILDPTHIQQTIIIPRGNQRNHQQPRTRSEGERRDSPHNQQRGTWRDENKGNISQRNIIIIIIITAVSSSSSSRSSSSLSSRASHCSNKTKQTSTDRSRSSFSLNIDITIINIINIIIIIIIIVIIVFIIIESLIIECDCDG